MLYHVPNLVREKKRVSDCPLKIQADSRDYTLEIHAEFKRSLPLKRCAHIELMTKCLLLGFDSSKRKLKKKLTDSLSLLRTQTRKISVVIKALFRP